MWISEAASQSLLPTKGIEMTQRSSLSTLHSPDYIFARWLKTIREKLEITILNIYLAINNIPEPDGVQDLIRRRQREAEFTSRFCRNYLYQFHRQVLALQHRLREKSCCGLQNIYKASMRQKLLNAYELAHLALQAVLNQIPTSVLICIPKKLREFLKLILELTDISSKSGVISNDREESGDEIEKCCRDLLMVIPDPDENLNVHCCGQNVTANTGCNRTTLKNYGKFSSANRFSMYTENLSLKKRKKIVRSVSSSKKSVQGKESRTPLGSSQSSHNNELSRYKEMSVPKSQLTKNGTKKRRDEHYKIVERMSVKKHMPAPFNMDNVKTVIETISSDKCEENFQREEHKRVLPGNFSLTPEHQMEAIKNTTVTKCENSNHNKIEFQTSSKMLPNVRLIILPPYEESDSVSDRRIKGSTLSQAAKCSKNVESVKNGLNVSRPTEELKDDKVTYSVEHTSQSAVKDSSCGASLPPQSLFRPLHLEKMLTYETKSCMHVQEIGTSPSEEKFSTEVIELDISQPAVRDSSHGISLSPQSLLGPLDVTKMVTYGTKACVPMQEIGTSPSEDKFTEVIELEAKGLLASNPQNGSYLQTMVTHEKDDDFYMQGTNTVCVQGISTVSGSSTAKAEKLAEQQGNGTALSVITNKCSPETSKNQLLLKISVMELECVLEHKKRFVQYMNNNPLYMNSAKPWLIVSRLADTLISDVLHEIINEMDKIVTKLITQMFNLELE